MEILIVIILITINGLLSLAEISLIAARRSSLKSDAQNGSKNAELALKLAGEPDRFLPTTQIGITITAILMGVYSSEIAGPDLINFIAKFGISEIYAANIAEVLVIIAVSYVALIFGELVPKRIGMTIAERTAKATAIPMNFFSILASPIIRLLGKNTSFIIKLLGINSSKTKVTEEEIKSLIHEGTIVGEVQEVEQDIVERVFSLGDRSVSSIMSHRSNIVWLDVNWSKDKLKQAITNDLCDLYPVAKDQLDNMLGVVYLKDLFIKLDSPVFDIMEILQPAQYFHEHTNIYKALETMKENRVEYGLIWDEYGSCQGIFTLKDLLDALVGVIPVNHEKTYAIQTMGDGWLISGQCSFFDFLAFFDVRNTTHTQAHNTVGGLILDQLEHIPTEGEQLNWGVFSFEIIKMDGVRIDKVMVNKME